MSVRKCPKCSSTWSSALVRCAFCGVEGEEITIPVPASRLNIGPGNPAAPKVEEKPAPTTGAGQGPPLEPAELSTPKEGPPSAADASRAKEGPTPPAGGKPVETAPEVPPPAPVVETPKEKPEPPAEKGLEDRHARVHKHVRPDPSLAAPAAPLIPSATVPLVFGLLGTVAWLTLPLLVYMAPRKVLEVMALLAWAILAPFAPFGWFAGLRYEDRCRELGFRPAAGARTGRVLGMTGTFLVVFEVATLAVLLAIQRLSGTAPNPLLW